MWMELIRTDAGTGSLVLMPTAIAVAMSGIPYLELRRATADTLALWAAAVALFVHVGDALLMRGAISAI